MHWVVNVSKCWFYLLKSSKDFQIWEMPLATRKAVSTKIFLKLLKIAGIEAIANKKAEAMSVYHISPHMIGIFFSQKSVYKTG